MKKIIDCNTGETIERELNKAEKDQQKIDEAIIKEKQIEAELRAAERQAILDRLGITDDEAKLILG